MIEFECGEYHINSATVCFNAMLTVFCVCRRCFQIYRYPGKSATVITEADFVDKVKQLNVFLQYGTEVGFAEM